MTPARLDQLIEKWSSPGLSEIAASREYTSIFLRAWSSYLPGRRPIRDPVRAANRIKIRGRREDREEIARVLNETPFSPRSDDGQAAARNLFGFIQNGINHERDTLLIRPDYPHHPQCLAGSGRKMNRGMRRAAHRLRAIRIDDFEFVRGGVEVRYVHLTLREECVFLGGSQ